MNTKQLIVLWYVGFVVLLLLVADGWGIVWLRGNESATFALAAILFGGLVMYTQKNSLQFDKKLFAKWMSIPVLLLVAGTAYVISHESKVVKKMEVLAPLDQANVTGTAGLSYGGTLFSGNLYNGTNYFLRNVVINITAKEKNGKIRWSRQFADVVFIEPLTTGSFDVQVVGAEGAELDWSINEVKGAWQGDLPRK